MLLDVGCCWVLLAVVMVVVSAFVGYWMLFGSCYMSLGVVGCCWILLCVGCVGRMHVVWCCMMLLDAVGCCCMLLSVVEHRDPYILKMEAT